MFLSSAENTLPVEPICSKMRKKDRDNEGDRQRARERERDEHKGTQYKYGTINICLLLVLFHGGFLASDFYNVFSKPDTVFLHMYLQSFNQERQEQISC